ncbi:MAG: ATP-binding cassette domain-containing protein [Coprobacter sp.]|nr:ATP-binding cassette domain-containing protein [Coprobacter sp.]
MKPLIQLDCPVPRRPELAFRTPVRWSLREGEQWVFIGPNGSGKTLLADLLQRKIALREGAVGYPADEGLAARIKAMAFKDIHSLTDARTTYYQQRWHATETDGVPFVRDLLPAGAPDDDLRPLALRFGIDELLSRRILHLSSGELRKFLIFRVLLSRPRVLILDNPFIGLDAASRDQLRQMFDRLCRWSGLQLILLLADPRDIPDGMTHVQPLADRCLLPACSCADFLADTALQQRLFPEDDSLPAGLPAPTAAPSAHEVTLRLDDVCIRYGGRLVLDHIDWEVRNGEKWALLGPNGSGKSTLLSLVYADNPQSYATRLTLFDRRRGSGESIWDIKKHIGYVSPEIHLYYTEDVPALQVAASGFFDTVGLFRRCTPCQEAAALDWMRLFGVDRLSGRSFLSLSSGEQRLVLLARAFVKDPALLILDEPLHGLDAAAKRRVRRIIEAFSRRPGKTLIYVTHYPEELPPTVDRRFYLTKSR